MVVAVHGAEPVRVAGRRLPRLLRGALVAIGLTALAWLLSVVLGAGTAIAEPKPTQDPAPTQSTGLLGGLVGTIGGVLNTVTTTVGQLTGAVLNTVAPVISPPPQPPPAAAPQPQPATVTKPAPARAAPRVIIPVDRPAPAKAAPVQTPTPKAPPVVRKPAPATAKIAVVTVVVPRTEPTERANSSGPARSPAKAPVPLPASVAPAGSASSAHDGPGGTHGVLAGKAGLAPPTLASTNRGRVCEAGDTATGLPSASPD